MRILWLVSKMYILAFMTVWLTFLEYMVAVIIISMGIGHGSTRMPISLIQNTTAQRFCKMANQNGDGMAGGSG